DLLDPGKQPGPFANFVYTNLGPKDAAQRRLASFLATVADDRMDVQNSAPPNSSGTSSAVVRAGASDVLALALDAGAITQTVNGSSLTLQTNALSFYDFLTGRAPNLCDGPIDDCTKGPSWLLKKISGSATLNLSNASSQSVTGIVSGTGNN